MTNHQLRIGGVAAMAAPLLLLTSTAAYVAAGDGMNSGEGAGIVQVWAAIAFAVAAVSLARLLEPTSPRAAATLTVVTLVGAAGAIGYGIDSIQAALFQAGSIQDTTSAAGPLALQLPGILFPVGLIGLGLSLARAGAVPRWSGLTLAAGAVLFPMSRIPDIEALALASDLLLVAALVPIGWSVLKGAPARRPAPRPTRATTATA